MSLIPPQSEPQGGDTTHGPAMIAAASASTAVALLLLTVRIYIRIYRTKSFWWDDGLLVLGSVFSIISTSFNIMMVVHGAGRHQYYLSHKQTGKVFQYSILFTGLNMLCVCSVRLAILLSLYRIQNSKKVTYILATLGALSIVGGVGTFLFIMFHCIPLNALWDPSVHGRCVSRRVYANVSIAQGVIYCFIDLSITCIPVIILWGTKMKKATKVGVCILCGLGLCATAFLIMRVVLNEHLTASDLTFEMWLVNIVTQLEQNICIMAAAILTFPHLIKTWLRACQKSKFGSASGRTASFTMTPVSKSKKAGPRDRHPYNDITELSGITVQCEIEQQSQEWKEAFGPHTYALAAHIQSNSQAESDPFELNGHSRVEPDPFKAEIVVRNM